MRMRELQMLVSRFEIIKWQRSLFMEINAIERKAIDIKFKFPKRNVACPRCGKPLRYIATDSAEQVKCESNNCIKVTIRGI